MSANKQSTKIKDSSVNDSIQMGDGSSFSVTTTTADPTLAKNAIDKVAEVANDALGFNESLINRAMSANQDLANNFRDIAEGSQTTLRDTLAVALNSEQLAGKASASVAPSTKLIYGIIAALAVALLLIPALIPRRAS